jgi:cytoskeletal protein RodZ
LGGHPGLVEDIYRFATTRTPIRKENRTMTWILVNLLLAAPFFAIWVGVPLWLVLKHPDQDHQPQAASAPAHSHRAESLTCNSRSSPDAASTRPDQTGPARSRAALDSPTGRALHTTTAS